MGAATLFSANAVLWGLGVAARAALLLGAAGLASLALRRSSAAARHQLWTLGVVGALALPALGLTLPALRPAGAVWVSATSPTLLLPTLGVSALAAPAPAAWLGWLTLPWAVGALLVLGRTLLAHLAAGRLARRSEPATSPGWRAALAEAAATLGVKAPVDLRRSASIGSPMTVGLWSPVVLLPAEAEGWSPERLRAVLLHELGHVRRHDTRVQLVAQIVVALYWFNPLAWVAAARLRIEREHAADDLVLCAGVRPSSYAADLLEVARRLSAEDAARGGAICMAAPSGTEVRLRRVLSARTPRQPLSPRTRRAAWGLGLGLVGVLAATAAPLTGSASPSISYGALWAVRLEGDDGSQPPPALALNAPYDLSGVTEEVERRLPELEACFQRRLSERPGLSGEVSIHWGLLPSGQVNEQCIVKDTVGDEAVRACVNQLVASGPFEPPADELLDITLPLVFHPAS